MNTNRSSYYNDSTVIRDEILSELLPAAGPKPVVEYLIGPNLMFTLTIIIYYALQIPILLLGSATNILVMTTFIKSELNDSVTVCFFALSVSDFGYSILFFISRLAAMLQRLVQRPFAVRVDHLAFVLTHYGLIFNDASVLITVFTAVQKCCCVAIPHLFKRVFTPKRAAFVVIIMTAPLLCLYIPMNQGLKFQYGYHRLSNRSLIHVRAYPIYFEMNNVWKITSRIILPISAQGILLVCLIVMTVKLRQSAEFRGVSANLSDTIESTKSVESTRLGPKETRALRAVTVVSVIFVIATIPGTILFVFKYVFPVLLEKRYTNVNALVDNTQNIFYHVNAAVNLFVYLKYNTKFHKTFYEYHIILSSIFKSESGKK